MRRASSVVISHALDESLGLRAVKIAKILMDGLIIRTTSPLVPATGRAFMRNQ